MPMRISIAKPALTAAVVPAVKVTAAGAGGAPKASGDQPMSELPPRLAS